MASLNLRLPQYQLILIKGTMTNNPHWDAERLSTLCLYLLSNKRHGLLNHCVMTCPAEAFPRH